MRGVVLSIFVGALIMAGCGRGTTGSTTQDESRARFIALADVICKNHQSRREDLESQTIDLGRLNSRDKAHQVAALLRQQRSNLVGEVQELRARQPPPDDVDRVASILASIRAKADLIGEWAKAYDALDGAEIRTLQEQIGVATANARDGARAYGFKICGQD